MVFEPTGLESLVGNSDALRLPINIVVSRSRPLTTYMWERLFREMEQAALDTDMLIFDLSSTRGGTRYPEGFEYLRRQTNRFVVTSVSRGSIIVEGMFLLAAGGYWFFSHFIKPGYDMSQTKKDWDEAVKSTIDTAMPFLKTQVENRVVPKLKGLQIERISVQPPTNSEGHRLIENQMTPSIDLVYEKPKQAIELKKD